MIEGMIHSHVGSWGLGLVIFIVAVILLQAGKSKGAKIFHMILRLLYVIIIVSGGYLYNLYLQGGGNLGEVTVKAVAGIWVIFAMEFILVKMAKGQPTISYFVQLVLALIIAIILGFARLGLGFLP